MLGGVNMTDNAALHKDLSLLLHALQKMIRVLLEDVRSSLPHNTQARVGLMLAINPRCKLRSSACMLTCMHAGKQASWQAGRQAGMHACAT
jgi:hypothetical protein